MLVSMRAAVLILLLLGCAEPAEAVATEDAAIDSATVAADTAAVDSIAPDVAAETARSCKVDAECRCGEVCNAGSCVVSDCKANACPTGRTCKCVNGILDIDGRTGPQWPPDDVVLRRRPLIPADDGTTLEMRNYFVHDVVDQKAVHLTLTDGTSMYKAAHLRCFEIARVNRDAKGAEAGLHMDYIKIDGVQMGKPPAEVLLEDINVHDGNIYSLISDAAIATLTMRRMRHVDTGGSLQIGGKFGSIGEMRIEESPALHVALLDNKIGKIVVRTSPMTTGLELKKDEIPITYDAVSCPTRALGTKECCEKDGKTCP
jgi:hypothetical protein